MVLCTAQWTGFMLIGVFKPIRVVFLFKSFLALNIYELKMNRVQNTNSRWRWFPTQTKPNPFQHSNNASYKHQLGLRWSGTLSTISHHQKTIKNQLSVSPQARALILQIVCIVRPPPGPPSRIMTWCLITSCTVNWFNDQRQKLKTRNLETRSFKPSLSLSFHYPL